MKQFLYLDTDIVNSIIAQAEKGLVTSMSNENETSGTVETTYEDTITTSKTDKDKSNLELVEKNINVWKDLIVSFVDEFRNCFMDEITKV